MNSFCPFSNHLEMAHSLWEKMITPDSIVIDMTAGNGHDTLKLAELKPKKLIAIDIQKLALENAKIRTSDFDVEYIQISHAEFPDQLDNNSVDLAVYNLGYLPGGEKTLTTLTDSTIASITKMLPKLKSKGALSITCYPGHPEGKKEEEALLDWASKLKPVDWMVFSTRFINRKASPSLLWISAS